MTETSKATLTLQDFATAVSVIDICTERGALKGNELLIVGGLRERLAQFVRENSPAEEPTPAVDSFVEEPAPSED